MHTCCIDSYHDTNKTFKKKGAVALRIIHAIHRTTGKNIYDIVFPIATAATSQTYINFYEDKTSKTPSRFNNTSNSY